MCDTIMQINVYVQYK